MRYNNIYENRGSSMWMLHNTKAVSTITLIILIIISAIIGGVISYLFTIAYYIEMPPGTTVTITKVYIDEKNATAFKVSVLNPSYSPTDATITTIFVSLKTESKLYEILETDPSLVNGIIVPKGKTLNITCSLLRVEDRNMTWGEFAAKFAGETIIVHVFSSDAPAANIETKMPLVKLNVTDANFDSEISFRRFNITVMNDADSVVNLTIKDIILGGIEVEEISPELPQYIENGTSIHFEFKGDWHGVLSTSLGISTEEGYRFFEIINLTQAYATIQNVIIDEAYTDHFNITVSNLADSSNYVNVTKIVCTLENGTIIERYYDPPVGIMPNATYTFTINELWREYRGKTINVKAYFLQEFETETFTFITPSPILLKVLNEKETFNLQDRTHFNITLQNHQSSLEAVNITKIVVKETGETINDTKSAPQLPYGLIEAGQNKTFYCNITDWNTSPLGAGKNITLTIHVVANKTLEEHVFDFVFALPKAELNITEIINEEFGLTKYLNITVESFSYSIWNLTVSKVIVTLQNQTILVEDTVPENQIIIKPGEIAIVLCLFDWGKHPDTDIVVTIITTEGVEASTIFYIPEISP
jgi:archaellum component FlaF (FlaF/FlaG flagellin family)